MKQRLLPLLACGVFLLMCTATLLQGPAVQSDLGQFLPASDGQGPDLLLDTLQDSPASRILLLDLSGAPAPQLAASARALAGALAATPHFQHILGVDNALPEAEQALLFRYRFLLHAGQYDAPALRAALQQRLQELALGVTSSREQLRRDPTALQRLTLQRLGSTNAPQRHLGVWFSADRQHALLLLHTATPAFALDQQQRTLEAINQAWGKLATPSMKMQLSGPPLFGVQSRQRIRADSQRLTLLASLGVALLILLAYRSLPATLLVVLPLFSAILAGAAAVVAVFGQLHGIALAFGITLIGLTVDYPIHLFSHGGQQQAAARIWPTLRLGVLTSVLGFSALLFSQFQGLSQMGLFAISGILTAAAVTRWVLPALQGSAYQLHPSLLPAIRLTLGLSQRLALRGLLLVLLLASLGYLALSHHSLWENRLDRLSPIPAAQLEQDRQLRQRLHAAEPGQLLLLQQPEQELLLQQSEALAARLSEAQQQGLLDNFDAPSRYLPSAQRQLQHRAALPDDATLSAALTAASAGLPFRDGLFQPFSDELSAARTLPPLNAEALEGTLTGMRLAGLLRHNAAGWYALITLGGIHDQQAIARIATQGGAQLINIPQQASQLVAHYRNEALALGALGGVMILLLLALSLRSASRLLGVVLPVFTAITTTTALLLLLGERLSLFHLASLLLVLGIGLDYGLFFERCQQYRDDCQHTIGALLICSTTTLLVFGLLALSALPVLHAIGLTVSLGVVATLLFTLISRGGKSRQIV